MYSNKIPKEGAIGNLIVLKAVSKPLAILYFKENVFNVILGCRYRFKAQPVNMDMFRSRDENVHVSAKDTNQPLTKAHSPHLATKDRMQLRKRNRETTEETHSFVFKV